MGRSPQFNAAIFAAVTASAHAVAVTNSSSSASLADVCTPAYVAAHLPAAGYYGDYALSPLADSVTANPVYNYSVGATDSVFFPAATFDYCNVSFSYTHEGRDDAVVLTLWLPAPANYQNRFLTTGGGGYAINSQLQSLPGGVMYGAAAGQTDGGFGADASNAIDTFLVQNGTLDWQNVYMFGYQAIRELSLLGREFTSNFFNATGTKQYNYYQVGSPNSFSWRKILTKYLSRVALKEVVRDGLKSNAFPTRSTAPPSVPQPSASPSSRCSTCTPTWWSRP